MRKKDHPLYQRWEGMRARCKNPNHVAYGRYGAIGLKVCASWDDFWKFVEDMGPQPTKIHTIDRLNNELGYSSDNCRWATPAEQSRNTERNYWIEHEGHRLTIRDWEIKNGVRKGMYEMRRLRGWPDIEIVTQPIRPGFHLRSR